MVQDPHYMVTGIMTLEATAFFSLGLGSAIFPRLRTVHDRSTPTDDLIYMPSATSLLRGSIPGGSYIARSTTTTIEDPQLSFRQLLAGSVRSRAPNWSPCSTSASVSGRGDQPRTCAVRTGQEPGRRVNCRCPATVRIYPRNRLLFHSFSGVFLC